MTKAKYNRSFKGKGSQLPKYELKDASLENISVMNHCVCMTKAKYNASFKENSSQLPKYGLKDVNSET